MAPSGTPSSPNLSPDATLFFPGCSVAGCTKSRMWADDDGDESDDDHPATYLEATRRPTIPVTAPRARSQTHSVVPLGRGGAEAKCQRPDRRRRKRSRPRPCWCAAGRWLRPWLRPVWTCLFPNVGRSWEILPRLESSTKKQLLLAWKIPAELHSRCFNCISYSDRVATCQSTRLCLRYHGFCHIARDCKRLRHAATSAAKGGDWPRPSTPRAS